MPIPVLIVGAGPSGLAAALSLSKYQIPVRIIDKAPFTPPGQRGAGIHPRTLELHHLLGTLPDIQAKGMIPLPMRAYLPPEFGKPAKDMRIAPIVDPTPDVPYSNALMLWQSRHAGVLKDHLAVNGVQVEWSTELQSFEQSPGHVTATVKKSVDGSEPTTETIDALYIISAEGAHSVVRRTLGLTFLGDTMTQKLVIGDVEVLEGLDRDFWHFFGDPSDNMFSLGPCEDRTSKYCNVLNTGPSSNLEKISASREAFIEAFYEFTGRRDIKFGKMLWISLYTPNLRMVDKFSEGRCFVVGDAAHVHSPAGGQGLNSGFQDSVNLAWKLAHVLKGHSPPSLLETYNSERLPVIAAMLNKTNLVYKASFSKESGKEDLSRVVTSRGPELNMLGINYRSGPLVVDTVNDEAVKKSGDVYKGGKGLCAGDRAPDAPSLVPTGAKDEKSTRLFDMFSYTRHTILIFASSPDDSHPFLDTVISGGHGDLMKAVVILPAGCSRVDSHYGAETFEDKAGYAYRAYYPAQTSNFKPMVVVVRPDMYIGALVEKVKDLREYYGRIFS